MEKIAIKEALVVEGHYDVKAVAQVIDTQIIETNGFGVFKDKPLQKLIGRLAREQGIIILTDSDSAGFKIRAFVSGLVPQEQVKHAYVPEIEGKEKRKQSPSKSFLLGVEGMEGTVIQNIIASVSTQEERPANVYDKMLFYHLGLSGSKDSAIKRRALLTKLGLPTRLSSKTMAKILPALMSQEQLMNFLSNNDNE